MRRVPVFAVMFLVALPAFAQLPTNNLEGTWEMISQRLVYPDSTVDRGRFLGPAYKVLNSTHFAFGRQTIIDGSVEDDVYAGGGRYTLDGSKYSEHIEYHSSAVLVGTTVTFNARIEGDKWYHTGQIGDMILEEVWQRVE